METGTPDSKPSVTNRRFPVREAVVFEAEGDALEHRHGVG
jgi:hypothetical protein